MLEDELRSLSEKQLAQLVEVDEASSVRACYLERQLLVVEVAWKREDYVCKLPVDVLTPSVDRRR